MPRIRSLKYEYFINEELAQISLEARLMGLGLTTLADREGRLEDRPLRIKVLLFPYHDVDADKAINELQAAGFLERYTVEGKAYIRIVNFLKHQKPHPREADSVIPSHEKANPRHAKARPSREKATKPSTQEIPCQTQQGGLGDLCLGDLGSSVSGNGLGDLGEGDSVGTGASAPQSKSTEEVTIWKLGVGKLMDTGSSETDARAFFGQQVKSYGKPAVARAVTEMYAQEPAEPRAYIVAVLQGQNGSRRPKTNVEHSIESTRRFIERKEAEIASRNGN